jgi:hypothetical protein
MTYAALAISIVTLIWLILVARAVLRTGDAVIYLLRREAARLGRAKDPDYTIDADRYLEAVTRGLRCPRPKPAPTVTTRGDGTGE